MNREELLEMICKAEAMGQEKEPICAAILFELAREEMETNSIYSLAAGYIAKVLGENSVEIMDNFAEIMGDEDNHCTRFKALASALLDIVEPED